MSFFIDPYGGGPQAGFINGGAGGGGQRKQKAPTNPNELYVGDLSYFCEEVHLLEIFRRFGTVESCRVVRNENQTRSLQFGFVVMSTTDQAINAAETLNNQMFMGRVLKVELSAKRRTMTSTSSARSARTAYVMDGFQIFLSFASTFHPDHVIKPTEVFLADYFIQFGPIVEVVVKEYTIHPGETRQEGYGFLTFEEEEAAVRAAHHCSSRAIVHGIAIGATLSFRNRKTGKVYDLGNGQVYVSTSDPNAQQSPLDQQRPKNFQFHPGQLSGQSNRIGGSGHPGSVSGQQGMTAFDSRQQGHFQQGGYPNQRQQFQGQSMSLQPWQQQQSFQSRNPTPSYQQEMLMNAGFNRTQRGVGDFQQPYFNNGRNGMSINSIGMSGMNDSFANRSNFGINHMQQSIGNTRFNNMPQNNFDMNNRRGYQQQQQQFPQAQNSFGNRIGQDVNQYSLSNASQQYQQQQRALQNATVIDRFTQDNMYSGQSGRANMSQEQQMLMQQRQQLLDRQQQFQLQQQQQDQWQASMRSNNLRSEEDVLFPTQMQSPMRGRDQERSNSLSLSSDYGLFDRDNDLAGQQHMNNLLSGLSLEQKNALDWPDHEEIEAMGQDNSHFSVSREDSGASSLAMNGNQNLQQESSENLSPYHNLDFLPDDDN